MKKILIATLISITVVTVGVGMVKYKKYAERRQQDRVSLMERVHTLQVQGFECPVLSEKELWAVCDNAK